jgi:hypothetical protein
VWIASSTSNNGVPKLAVIFSRLHDAIVDVATDTASPARTPACRGVAELVRNNLHGHGGVDVGVEVNDDFVRADAPDRLGEVDRLSVEGDPGRLFDLIG